MILFKGIFYVCGLMMFFKFNINLSIDFWLILHVFPILIYVLYFSFNIKSSTMYYF